MYLGRGKLIHTPSQVVCTVLPQGTELSFCGLRLSPLVLRGTLIILCLCYSPFSVFKSWTAVLLHSLVTHTFFSSVCYFQEILLCEHHKKHYIHWSITYLFYCYTSADALTYFPVLEGNLFLYPHVLYLVHM